MVRRHLGRLRIPAFREQRRIHIFDAFECIEFVIIGQLVAAHVVTLYTIDSLLTVSL